MSSQRNEEFKSSTFSTLCHDLASPLQVIRACTDVMELELQKGTDPKTAHMQELLGAAKRNERRLEEMVRTIRAIPKLEEEDIHVSEPIRPDEAVNSVCTDYQLLLRDDETLEWYVPRNLPDIMMDSSLFNRILFNLLDNARRYIHSGGRIVVSAQQDPDSAHVTFTVFDDGDAIAPEFQYRIFDKNMVLDIVKGDCKMRRDHGGGLYFCRLTVERCGGSIRVESREGWGTEFSFSVPIAAASRPAAQSPGSRHTPYSPSVRGVTH